MKVARERRTNVIMTIGDIEELGLEKAAEIALELAWKDADAVYPLVRYRLVDSGFVPGTGSPEPGGLLPREALKLRMVAREGICGMEVVEVSPPYDISDITALLGVRAIMDVLGTMVEEGHLGAGPAGRSESRGSTTSAKRRRVRTSPESLQFLWGTGRGTGRVPHRALRRRAAPGRPGDRAAARAASRAPTPTTWWPSPRSWRRRTAMREALRAWGRGGARPRGGACRAWRSADRLEGRSAGCSRPARRR